MAVSTHIWTFNARTLHETQKQRMISIPILLAPTGALEVMMFYYRPAPSFWDFYSTHAAGLQQLLHITTIWSMQLRATHATKEHANTILIYNNPICRQYICTPYGLMLSQQVAWQRKIRFWNEAQWLRRGHAGCHYDDDDDSFFRNSLNLQIM